MAKYSSADVGFFLLGSYSLLGMTSKFEDTVEHTLNETPVLGTADEDFWSSGAKKTTIVQEGYFDDSTGSIHDAFVGLNSTTALPLSFGVNGNVNARAFDCYQSVQRVGYQRMVEVAGVTRARGDYGVWYGKKQFYIAHALGTETTAGNSDSLDVHPFVANLSNGGFMVLHVTALSGCADCTIALRHSTDGGTYAEKTAFTAVTPANVAAGTATQYATLTTTVNQYVSVSWAYSTPTTPSVTFMVGVYQTPS